MFKRVEDWLKSRRVVREQSALVRKDNQKRVTFNGRTCPACGGENSAIALGSERQGFCWFEHSCGSYSPSASTWESAYEKWLKDPQKLPKNTGIKMYPPIGG